MTPTQIKSELRSTQRQMNLLINELFRKTISSTDSPPEEEIEHDCRPRVEVNEYNDCDQYVEQTEDWEEEELDLGWSHSAIDPSVSVPENTPSPVAEIKRRDKENWAKLRGVLQAGESTGAWGQ